MDLPSHFKHRLTPTTKIDKRPFSGKCRQRSPEMQAKASGPHLSQLSALRQVPRVVQRGEPGAEPGGNFRSKESS